MKLAIIVTGSGYIYFLYSLGSYLKSKGIEIIYVFENKYEIYKAGYQKIFEKEKTSFLIDFRDKNLGLQQKYEWLPLFSTFERVTTFGYKTTSLDLEKMLIAEHHRWDYLFQEEKIDGVINESVSDTTSYVAYLKCLQYKKKYIGIIDPPWFSGRIIISNDLYGVKEISRFFNIYLKTGKNILNKELINIYKKIISPIFSPDCMKNNPTSVNYSLFNHYFRKFYLIKNYIIYYLKEYKNIKKSFEHKDPLWTSWRMILREIKRKIAVKIMLIRKYCALPNYNEKFLIYPLHFHPEASTSINARPFIDELSVIKNIAFSLPDGYKLYVKVHPNGFGYEGIQFYKKIRVIPRVKLIAYFINSRELIAKSAGLITLTSTMGFEALMLKKPVFVLGNIFYQVHPYCSKIGNLYSLPEILKKGLNKEYKEELFEKYSLLFLRAYYDSSFPGKFELSKKQNPQNIKRIGDEIISRA